MTLPSVKNTVTERSVPQLKTRKIKSKNVRSRPQGERSRRSRAYPFRVPFEGGTAVHLQEGLPVRHCYAEQFGISTHSVKRWSANAYRREWGTGAATRSLRAWWQDSRVPDRRSSQRMPLRSGRRHPEYGPRRIADISCKRFFLMPTTPATVHRDAVGKGAD